MANELQNKRLLVGPNLDLSLIWRKQIRQKNELWYLIKLIADTKWVH